MQKKYHKYRFEDYVPLREKRLIFEAPDATKPNAPETQQAQKELGQIKLEQRLGLSPEQAKNAIEDKLGSKESMVKEMIDNWFFSSLQPLRMAGNLISRGIIDENNKAKLSEKLEGFAKSKALEQANEVFKGDADKIAAHAENSLNILSQKSELAGKLINNLKTEVSSLEQRQKRANASMNALGKLKAFGADAISSAIGQRSDTLQGALNRYRAMLSTTEEIKSEADTKLNKGNVKKNGIVRGWHENVVAMLGPAIPENRQDELVKAMRELGLHGKRELIDALITEFRGQITSTEASGINSNINLLIKGDVGTRIYGAGTSVGEWMAEKASMVSRNDVYQYYLNQAFEIGKSNLEDNFEDRMKKMMKSPPGQKVKIGNDEYFIARHDSDGFLLRKKGSPEAEVYINPKNGVLSEKSGEEVSTIAGKVVKKAKFSFKKIDVDKTPSDESLNFLVDTTKVIKPQEAVSEKGIPEPGKTEGLFGRIKKATKILVYGSEKA